MKQDTSLIQHMKEAIAIPAPAPEVTSILFLTLTVKDHKPNFQNDTKCRLINPAKPQIGRESFQPKATEYQ